MKEATGSNHRTSAKSRWPQQDRRGLPEEAKRRHLTTDSSFIASHSPASISLRKPQAVSWHICPSLTGLHQWETFESRTASWAFMAMPECQYKCNNFTDKFTDLKTLWALVNYVCSSGWIYNLEVLYLSIFHFMLLRTSSPLHLRGKCGHFGASLS